MEIALFILLAVCVVILHYCVLLYLDDIKARIDRRVDEDKWQNDKIASLYERVNKLEKRK